MTQPIDLSRYVSVTLEAIRTFVPHDYHIEVHPETAQMPDCGMHWITYFSTSFDADQSWWPRKLVIPAPITPLCLFIAMHEVGHIACRHGKQWHPGMEFEASAWGKKWIESKGLLVPQDVLDLAAGINGEVEEDEARDRAFASFEIL